MKTILITGASGLIGTELINSLSNSNYNIKTVGRYKKDNNKNHFTWDINKSFIEKDCLKNVDHIIHLAGAGIANKRWSDKRKEEIINSRINSTQLLFNKVSKLSVKPKTFICASAIGYYGATTSEKIFSEEDNSGNDFQAKVCKLWEESADQFSKLNIRTTKLRLGVVLSSKGGALKKMLLPTKLGLGSALGSGKQYFPWIHIDDVIGIIEKIISDNSIKGVYNTVSSNHVTNYEFSKSLSKVLGKPFFMPNVPKLILKMLFGEMSEIILEGSKISNNKIKSAGYNFKHTSLESALKDLITNN